ncbi:MAG: preprotein translocase subunit SecG [Hyphomicrobium sp.]|jgi:preprotein translocase subunit SecG
MLTALLVLHLMVASSLVAVVLLQRSEGGALGIGGGGGGGAGGLLTGRGTANLLTRATALLALAFFTTSILLTLMAQRAAPNASILDAGGTASPSAPVTPGSKPAEAPSGRGGILDKLQQGQGGGPAVPQSR